MSFADHFKDVTAWVHENHPSLRGYRIRSFAWEYDISSLKYELANVAQNAMEANGEVRAEDFDGCVERVKPPEGYAYVTLQKDKERVGVNVPCGVFQPAAAKPEGDK